jgi:hypothetical protein
LGGKNEMNKKIFGIIIFITLMSAFITNAQNVTTESFNSESEEIDMLSFDEANVPIWEEGNNWIYKVDEIVIEFEEPDLYIYIEGDIDDLSLEVEKVTAEYYELKLSADIFGSYKLDTDFGDGPINITGELKNTIIQGTITYNKTDLGIAKVNVEISGRLTVRIINQPYFDSSFLPDIPIPATIILDVELGNPYPIIEFPLSIGKCWGFPATSFSLGGTIESPWLKLANFLNNIIRIPGVIPVLAAILDTDQYLLENISDILKDILPIIDIEYVLNTYLETGNVFEIPEVPPLLCCFGKDNITVPAGDDPFEAYNISLMGSSFGNIYYSEETGNIIKITGNFKDVLPFVSDINAELVAYSYTPS